MKTNILNTKNTLLYSFIGVLSALLTSCGSYQNSSYYDSDGIYGNTATINIDRETQNNRYTKTQYKDYFESLQNDNETNEIFTNVDDYNSYDLDQNVADNNHKNYAGWGSNPQNISINVYDNGWAMNNWYGSNYYGNNWYGNSFYGDRYYGNNWYGNNFYGNNWGWNYGYGWGTNVGFGWNNWYGNNYYGNNYYGNNWRNSNYYDNRDRSYNVGRRGSISTNSRDNNRNSANSRIETNTISRRALDSNNRQSNDLRRNSSDRNLRTTPTFSRNQPQIQNNSQNNNQNVPRRGNTNNGRIENNSSQRSYTPSSRSEDNSRSYTPSSNNNSRSSGSEGRSSGGQSRSSGSRGGRG